MVLKQNVRRKGGAQIYYILASLTRQYVYFVQFGILLPQLYIILEAFSTYIPLNRYHWYIYIIAKPISKFNFYRIKSSSGSSLNRRRKQVTVSGNSPSLLCYTAINICSRYVNIRKQWLFKECIPLLRQTLNIGIYYCWWIRVKIPYELSTVSSRHTTYYEYLSRSRLVS